MKGPRKREASQPATILGFGHPLGALEDGARGKFILVCPSMQVYYLYRRVTRFTDEGKILCKVFACRGESPDLLMKAKFCAKYFLVEESHEIY